METAPKRGDIGIARVAVAEGVATIHVDYWSTAALDDSALDSLLEFTAGQMSDRAGEGGFEFAEHGRQFHVNADLANRKDLTINVEKGIDDTGLEHLSRLVNLESLSIIRTAKVRGPGYA